MKPTSRRTPPARFICGTGWSSATCRRKANREAPVPCRACRHPRERRHHVPEGPDGTALRGGPGGASRHRRPRERVGRGAADSHVHRQVQGMGRDHRDAGPDGRRGAKGPAVGPDRPAHSPTEPRPGTGRAGQSSRAAGDGQGAAQAERSLVPVAVDLGDRIRVLQPGPRDGERGRGQRRGRPPNRQGCDGRHPGASTDHRLDTRARCRAAHRDLEPDVGRRHGDSQDGESRYRPGFGHGGGNGHRPSAAGPPGHDHSRCVPEPRLRRHRAEDRPAGADHAERHELPGVREHPEPRTPPQARDEYGGTDSHRTARRCARGAVRRAPDPARRGLRRGGSRTRRPTGRAADRRRDRGGRSAAPRGRLDGPPHLAGTGTRNVHHSERPGDHAPTGGDSRSGTAGDSQHAARRRADRSGRGAAGFGAAASAAGGGGAMSRRPGHRRGVVATFLAAIASCRKAPPAPAYETVPVARRDIIVSATASGVIQPILTLSVKSKASGEIIAMPVQTGDEVKKGQLLAKVDPRIPQNNLTQAQANLTVAKAQLDNATAQLKRSQALYQTQSITQAGYDSAQLAGATAQAAVVNAQASLQTAKDAMEDTHLGAPITGTVLELDAVLGTVISSPTNDVGGGTVILKMANLDTVQVSALVDETDVGKVQAGMPVTITVDAFPNRTFDGSVLKIAPQAKVTQNVTMFPVQVNVPNAGHVLKPGMNTEVEIHIGQRQGVLAVPNAALRTPRDVASAARVLGLDVQAVERQLASPDSNGGNATPLAGADTTDGSKLHPAEPKPGRATVTTPGGRVITLPPGVTPEQVKAAFAKRMTGQELTPAEQALLAQIRGQFQAPPQGDAGGGGAGGAGGAGGGGAGAPRALLVAPRGGEITARRVR